MKYVVIGADVIVSAYSAKSGASHQLLRAVANGRITPLLSTPLMMEYETALKSPEARLEHKLSLADVDAALSAFASAAEAIDVTFLWRPQMKDPNDELVLEAAVNGNADGIITHDVRTFAAHGAIFDIKATTPTDYLKELAL